MCGGTKLGWEERPTATKNHFALEISLSRTQDTSLSPKNLPPRSHNFHQSEKKKKLQEELSSGGKLRQSAPVRAESSQDTQQAPPALGRWLGRLWGWLPLQVWGCAAGPKKRGHSARIRTPPHHREQWAERRVEEKRDNAGPGWRFRTLHGSPAPLPPRAASCRAKFAAPPSLLGPGGEAVAADLPPPRRHRLPPRGAAPGSRRGGGARASRMGPAKGTGHAGESRELEGRRARDGKGARKEAARTEGAGRAGERGARRAALPEDPLPLRRIFE